METPLGLIESYGIPTVTIAAVIVTAIRIIDQILKNHEREGETEQKKIESQLDDTETLRFITREDRAWLVKAQERSEILVQKSMEMLEALSDCKGEMAKLKQELEDERTERLQEKILWEQLRKQDNLEREQEKLDMQQEISDLKRRLTEMETQLLVKEQIIEQLKAK